MRAMRSRRLLLVASIPWLALACSSLKVGDPSGSPEPDASEPGPPPPEAGTPPDGAAAPDVLTTPDTSPDTRPDARADAGDANPDAPFTPGPLETVAENLLAGLGVATTSSHVYWYERGAAAGSNWDAVFRRLPFTQICGAGENCGAMLFRSGGFPTYFGDWHTGPVASDSIACISVIYNATRETELSCLRQSDGTVVRAPGTQFAATVRFAASGDLYFSVPARPAQTTSYVRKWSVATPTVAPTDVLTRTTSNIQSFVVDGATFFWVESSGSTSSVWTQGTGAPEQLALPRPGDAELTVDGSFVYVSRTTEGKVLRYPRTGLTAGVEIATNKKSPGSLARRGDYLLRLDYGDPPDYANGELSRCSPDGTACVTLDLDPGQSGFAATANTAYVVTFGSPPNYRGTVKRIRFAP